MTSVGRPYLAAAALLFLAVVLAVWWSGGEVAPAPTGSAPLQLPAGATRLPAPPGRAPMARTAPAARPAPPPPRDLNEAVAGTEGWSQLGASFGTPEAATLEVAAGAAVAKVGAEGSLCLRGRGGTRTRRIQVLLTLRLGEAGLEDAEIALEQPAVVPETFVSCLSDAVWSLDWPATPAPTELSFPVSIGAGGAE